MVPVWVPVRDAGMFVEVRARFEAVLPQGKINCLAAEQSIDIPGLYDDDGLDGVIDQIFSQRTHATCKILGNLGTPAASAAVWDSRPW